MMNKTAMILAGLFLFMGMGAASGGQIDPASSSLVTQPSGPSVGSNALPTGASSSTASQSQLLRRPVTGNQAPPLTAGGQANQGASRVQDIRDIRGPLHLPDPVAWLMYAGAGLLLLLAAAGFWKWLRRRKTEREKPAFELALEQLEHAKAFMKPETADKFSVMVSDAVRGYIEKRFEMKVTRSTTEEFMKRIAVDSPREIRPYEDLLNGFLRYCDLAKFARYALTQKQMEEMIQSAVHFVDATKPRPEDQEKGRNTKKGEADVQEKAVLKRPSLIKRCVGKGLGFISRKTAMPEALEQGNVVAEGGR